MSRSYKKTGGDSICSSYGDKWCRNYYHRTDRRKVRQLLNQVQYDNNSSIEIDCGLCLDFYFSDDLLYDIPYSKYMDEPYLPDYNECHNHRCFEIGYFPEDDILTKGIDRSLKFSSKWEWGSDGGSYWKDDISSYRKEFDRDVFGLDARHTNTIWEKYKSNRDSYRNDPYEKKWRVRLTYVTGRRIRDYFGGRWVDETYYKFVDIPYKKHVLEIPSEYDGYVEYKNWRLKNYQRRQPHSDWFLMDFLFYRNIIPRDFQSPEELISWLRRNQESIIKKWFRSRYSK